MWDWFQKPLSTGVFEFSKEEATPSPKGGKQKSTSKGTSLVSCGFVGRPVWTPRRYDALAEEGYQTNVIVYRSVNLISKGVSSVPWRLTKGRQKGFCGGSHPLMQLLQAPNPKQGGASFIESVISHLLLAGNAYVELLHDGRGKPAELHALRPDRVQVVPGEDGTVAAYEYKVNGQARLIQAKSILHIRCFHPLNDWYGLSPLEACARSIDQHNCVASHNLSLMQNGGRPSGALIVGPNSENLTHEQREELRENLQALYEGSKNAGRTLILEGDFRWQEMGLSPKDMDFLEGKRMSAREIAQAYGVPPMLVGIPGDSTFANFKEARLHLWEETILPQLDSLTDELNRWLVPFFGADLCLSYDIDSIPALAAKRESAWARLQNVDFLTLNEKRQSVGFPPLKGGDTLEIEQNS